MTLRETPWRGQLAPVTGASRLPECLQEATQLRAAIQESLSEMQAAGRAHLHPQKPEARLMPCEGRLDPAYNAQAVAD